MPHSQNLNLVLIAKKTHMWSALPSTTHTSLKLSMMHCMRSPCVEYYHPVTLIIRAQNVKYKTFIVYNSTSQRHYAHRIGCIGTLTINRYSSCVRFPFIKFISRLSSRLVSFCTPAFHHRIHTSWHFSHSIFLDFETLFAHTLFVVKHDNNEYNGKLIKMFAHLSNTPAYCGRLNRLAHYMCAMIV